MSNYNENMSKEEFMKEWTRTLNMLNYSINGKQELALQQFKAIFARKHNCMSADLFIKELVNQCNESKMDMPLFVNSNYHKYVK